MKGALTFDPSEHDYGPASVAVRSILRGWADIDWYASPERRDVEGHARSLFEAHQALARAVLPDAFPSDITISHARGDHDDFVALCDRVRSARGPWDWKFGALKKLAAEHAQRCNWSRRDAARDVPFTAAPPMGNGELYFRFGDIVLSNVIAPRLDPASHAPGFAHQDIAWYSGYANMDLTDAIDWQLAEATSDVSTNAFIPLLGVYECGLLPFSIGKREMLLFEFEPD